MRSRRSRPIENQPRKSFLAAAFRIMHFFYLKQLFGDFFPLVNVTLDLCCSVQSLVATIHSLNRKSSTLYSVGK